ncbi:hypothetical protein BDV93DRAFT_77180 [Ceratobasidium sp. AG-I]|nr:hypothetical protein BDV93DRAFT_77180 [Ceratobasidium sp. AG-I]
MNELQSASPHVTNVFLLPELLEIISMFLSPHDAFHLAQSSHMCFSAAVRRIWQNLESTLHLFMLLPGTTFEAPELNKTIISLPNLETCDFTRFDFYASLVKSFTRHHIHTETIPDPGMLVSYAHRKALLPNLLCIELPAGAVANDIFWATVLICPSLIIFQTGASSRQPHLEIQTASAMFEDIALRCPALRVLDLFYVANFTYEPVSLTSPFDSSLCQHVGAMQNLRVLCTTTEIFEAAALQLIAKLPQLRILETHGTSPLPLQLSTPDLPRDSFPALQILRLSTLRTADFVNVWKIGPFVSKPTTIKLYFSEPYADNDLTMLLLEVCLRSPQLCRLKLGYMRGMMWHPAPNFFWPLQQISLERLHTSGINLSSPEATCAALAIATPLLRRLNTGTWVVLVPELRCFAQLSRLEYLKVGVDWGSCIELNPSNMKPLFMCESFRRLKWTILSGTPVEPSLIRRTTMYV